MKPRVGLVPFSEPRTGVYDTRKDMVEQEVGRLTRVLGSSLDLVTTNPVRFKPDLLKTLALLRGQGVESAILHVPVFTAANLVVMAARLLDIPVIVVGNTRPESHSTVGFLASTGGLDQVGLKYEAVLAETESTALVDRVSSFCAAASAVARLRGRTLGLFGGRALGLTIANVDPAEWIRLFGVDIEHVDQGEIIRRATRIPEAMAQGHMTWLTRRVQKIEYNTSSLNDVTLRKQVKSYLATREIGREMHLDFMSIECQTYLSDNFALQCLNCALNNDPYDADGPKEPIVCSCEGDLDGALTMQILKLVSGGSPVALLDVRYIGDDGLVTLTNCGSVPTWFACRADTPETNLAQIHLVPHIFGKAGGASLQFVCDSGPVTLARLSRLGTSYRMVVAKGATMKMPREALNRTTWAFPHAFFGGKSDTATLLRSLRANHIHMVAGDYADALKQFCGIVGLECEVIGEEGDCAKGK
ncbi:MAG: L-fucose/L-arabinose isomerase family protein [Bacillota bacterium]